MSSRVDLWAFPKWKVCGTDLSSSFNSWLNQFEVSVELVTLNLGEEEVDNRNGGKKKVDKFRGRTKLLALLSAIGSDGMGILQSLGF